MKEINVIICGFGNIGKSFAEIYDKKRAFVLKKYGLDLIIKAVVDINGSAVSNGNLPIKEIVDHVNQRNPIESFPGLGKSGYTVFDALKEIEPGVMIECTPTDINTGEPGLSHVRSAIENKWNLVLANKGPLIAAFRELHNTAAQAGVKMKYSGAAAAALPTLDVGRTSLAGSDIISFEGILNGTSNYILTGMFDNKESYNNALKKAQKLGIAESDPSLDVEGYDTANKTLIIANSLMEGDLKLEDISIEGITSISIDQIDELRKKDYILKLIGKAEITAGTVKAVVKPLILDRDHPLYNVKGAQKGIVFTSDTLGKIIVTGGESSITGTAACLLKDLINIYI